MKKMKILAAVTAAAAAVSAMAVSSFAYDLNTDLMTGWSASVTVPGSEFESVDADTVITITYTADKTLADGPESEAYWCVKPMVNDTGWPLIEGITDLELSESKDTYTLDPDKTEINFRLPEASIETIKTAGIAFMGHGVTLNALEIGVGTIDETPAESEAPTTGDSSKPNVETGAEGIAAAAGVAVIAAGAAVIARKRK